MPRTKRHALTPLAETRRRVLRAKFLANGMATVEESTMATPTRMEDMCESTADEEAESEAERSSRVTEIRIGYPVT